MEREKEGVVRMMHIGELAENTGLSLRTIRHYDEVGLLKPTGRSEGGFRLYTKEDYERLMVIRRMKPLGFSLEAMADLLRLVQEIDGSADGTEDQLHRLDEFIEAAEQQRQKLRDQLEMADEFLTLLRSKRGS